MQLFSYLIFRAFAGSFAIIPFRVLYIISDVFYYIMFYVIRYRKDVVINNLSKAFPGKTGKEVSIIARNYYRYLADITVESIKGLTMSKKSIVARHKILNPELLYEYYKNNLSVIGVSGHYGNWEWGSTSGGLQIKHLPVAFYKTLNNPYIDSYIKKNREKCRTQLVSIKETYEAFLTYKDKACIFVMIADQSPASIYLEKSYWLDFMGIDTAFLYGPEKYAKMYNFPVVYFDIRPVKRGFYEVEFIRLTDNPKELKDGELTQMFAQLLEKRIKENPQYWIWSHRRWKRTRQKLSA